MERPQIDRPHASPPLSSSFGFTLGSGGRSARRWGGARTGELEGRRVFVLSWSAPGSPLWWRVRVMGKQKENWEASKAWWTSTVRSWDGGRGSESWGLESETFGQRPWHSWSVRPGKGRNGDDKCACGTRTGSSRCSLREATNDWNYLNVIFFLFLLNLAF